MEPTASTLQVHTVINCNKTVIFSSMSFRHNSRYFGFFPVTCTKIIISEITMHIQKTVSVPSGSVFQKVIWSTLQSYTIKNYDTTTLRHDTELYTHSRTDSTVPLSLLILIVSAVTWYWSWRAFCTVISLRT